jgi:hypothetical protein
MKICSEVKCKEMADMLQMHLCVTMTKDLTSLKTLQELYILNWFTIYHVPQ